MLPFGHLRQANWRMVVGACSASGENPPLCTWRFWTDRRQISLLSAWIVPIAFIRQSASTTRRRFVWSAPSTSCLDCRRNAFPKVPPYRYLPVDGDSLHQIAVGPVHAGIIEPGHFRFTASGETVVRLEERLGYVHKGIEKLMQGASLKRAVQLAGRVSGDSTVAYSYAFSRATEAALELAVPDRAVW